MSDLNYLIKKLSAFRDERDWAQFHDPKNLAIALSIEAAELNELFLWKNSAEELEGVDIDEIADELADVLAYAFLLSDRLNLDPIKIVSNKIQKNAQKYPVDKVKGSAKKYSKYQGK